MSKSLKVTYPKQSQGFFLKKLWKHDHYVFREIGLRAHIKE